jgi:TRAP-type uncharacterized transport system substrate-binding protein
MKRLTSRTSLSVILIVIFSVFLSTTLIAQSKRPYTIVNFVAQFGSPQYTAGTAFEEVFKKADSWVRWQVQEIPGAAYNQRYIFENNEKMKSGEIPPVFRFGSSSIISWFIEGREPFEKHAIPEASGALFSTSSFITAFITFDESIKSTRDLVGKRVGVPPRSQVFMSTLALKPYFEKGLGIWDKVNWQYVGSGNSKDALLNNRIDVHMASFMGRVEPQEDGTLVVTAGAPMPPEMEIMNSGRKYYIISTDPEVVKKSYDFSVDMRLYPAVIKKGAIKGIDYDVQTMVANGIMFAPQYLPKDVVKEIIRVRYQYRKELANYHASLAFYPENPYPAGVPEEWVVPGVREAVEELGLVIPKD